MRVNLGNAIGGVAKFPIRAGLAAAELGIAFAAYGLEQVKQALGEEGMKPVDPITDVLPVRGAIVGANRVAELTEDDRALGRILARGGPADKLTRPGGVVDLLAEPGGLLDRLSDDTSSLERILAPGGLADRLLGEGGLFERMLAEDGMVERLFAEDGIIDKLTVKNGPLDQFTEAAEILSQLSPIVDSLTPTAETLQSGVDTLNRVANSLTVITDRIPRRKAMRAASGPKVIEGQSAIEG